MRAQTSNGGSERLITHRLRPESGSSGSDSPTTTPSAVSSETVESLEEVLQTSPVGIAILDGEGTIERANDRAEDLLGLTASDIEGRAYDEPEWNIYHETDVPVVPDEHPVTGVVETGTPVLGFTHGITLPDGTDRWLSSNSAPVFDDAGAVERIVVALEDVTRLKEQADRLERRQEELESELTDVFTRIEDGSYDLDSELWFTFVNERAEDLLGVDGHSILGRDVREELSLTEGSKTALQAALDGQEPVSMENYYPPLDAWFENTVYPDEDGLSVYFRDVTD